MRVGCGGWLRRGETMKSDDQGKEREVKGREVKVRGMQRGLGVRAELEKVAVRGKGCLSSEGWDGVWWAFKVSQHE